MKMAELNRTLLIVFKSLQCQHGLCTVGLILFSMNSLLLANLTKKKLEEARKLVSLHSGVAKVILLYNLNCVWFLQPFFE